MDATDQGLTKAIVKAQHPLDKPCNERTDEDVNIIYELCSRLAGFAIFEPKVRRGLASHAILAVIKDSGSEPLKHNADWNHYCVLIHGQCIHLDHTREKTIRHYNVGDSLGVCEPTTDMVPFEGYLQTQSENCAFLCVCRDDFIKILTNQPYIPIQQVIRHRDRSYKVTCVSHYKVDGNEASALCTDNISRYKYSYNSPIAKGHVIVKATEERLLAALVDGSDLYDPDFVDDFLLTFRVFMRNDSYGPEHRLPPGMTKLCDRLLHWLSETPNKNKVVKIVLTWLSSYYQDFEVDSNYSHTFFLNLERRLKTQSMEDQLNLLHVTLSAKSRTRQITISRSSREEHLPFTISGGYDKNCGIFVSQVFGYPNNSHDTLTRSTSRYSNPSLTTSLSMVAIEDRHRNNNIDRSHILKPGDQILEVNNINFRVIKLADAQKMLNDATHLSLTVKYNPSEYNEMLNLPEGRRKSSLSSISMSTLVTPSHLISQNIKNRKFSTSDSCRAHLDDAFYPPSPLHSSSSAFSFDTALKSSQNKAIKQSLNLKSIIASSKSIINQIRDSNSSNTNMDRISKASQDSISNAEPTSQTSKAKSNPDLTRTKLNSTPDPDSFKSRLTSNSNSIISSGNHQVNVLRVFNAATNDSKYLLIHEETTAREVVMIAVKEFNLANNQNQNNSNGDRTSSLDWALFEVSVVPEAKTIKQRRLPEQMSNLASRAPLRSRFYIKNNNQSSSYNATTRLEESGDSLFNEITKDCPEDLNIINLDPSLFAKELTLIDFSKFRRIEPQQFVYDTFFEHPSPSKPNKNQGNTNNRNVIVANNHDSASISSSTDSSSNEHSDKSTPTIPPDWMAEYTDFANISNKVMFWVVNEILREKKRDNRVKIMKKFLNVARECKELKNFNSLFAIISGLGHGCILRLRRTNEKLDSTYKNLFDEMNAIFNPSKNMSNYRTMLSETRPPAIPLFPQVKKDFYFIKENPTYVKESNSFNQDEEEISHIITRNNRDNNKYDVAPSEPYSILVNFEKMRLVAKQVRQVTFYASAPCLEYFLNDSRDHKKMHEEWLMRKRIQEYINKRLNCDTSDMRKDTLSINNNYKSHSQDCVDSTSTIDRNSSNRGPSSDQPVYTITYDERELFELSIKIEPDASSHNNDKQDKGRPDRAGMQPPVSSAPSMNSVNTATSSENGQPSPTLSKSSSLSSCSSFNSPSAQLRPNHHFHIPSYAYPARSGQINAGMLKFGADSPDKVRKLQSLSEEGVRMKSNNLNSGSVLGHLKHTDNNVGNQRHPGHIGLSQTSSTKLTRFISQDLTQQRRVSADPTVISTNNLLKQNTLQPHPKIDPIKLEPPPLPRNKQTQLLSQQHRVHSPPSSSPAPTPAAQSQKTASSLSPSISPIKPPIAPARSCSSSPNQPQLKRIIHNDAAPPIQVMPTNLSSKPLPTIPQNVNRPLLQQQQQQQQLQSKTLTRSNVSNARPVKNTIETENLQNPTDNRGFCHPAQPQYYAAKAARTKPTNQQPCSNLQCYHAAFQRRMDGTNGDSDSYSDEGDESNTNLTSVV